MCGIVGVVLKGTNGFFKPEEDAFFNLLYVDTLRGDDSTGVIGVEKDSTFHIAKEAVEASWFIPQFTTSQAYKDMYSKGKAYIGHNRKKTVGAVSDETAHPFTVGDTFAMVHNGTLYNHKTLADTVVDSEALAITFKKCLDADNYIEAFEDILPDVFGAYATAMYNQKTNKIHLLRNKERPLSIIETDKAWFFASEAPMLYWLLGRGGLIKEGAKVENVPEHTLITFDLDNNTKSSEALNVKKYTAPTTTAKGGSLVVVSKAHGFKQEGGLSKSQFKRFRRRFTGAILPWWSEDYVEVNFPRTELEGETLFHLSGTSDDVEHKHYIITTIDKKEKGFASADDMVNKRWFGRIDSMSYDPKAQMIRILMKDCTPVPPSKSAANDTVIDAKYIQDKLDEQARIEHEEEQEFLRRQQASPTVH